MPGRYAKKELSSGFVGSIDTYAYRMPIAPPVGIESQDDMDETVSDNGERQSATTGEVTSVAASDPN